MPEPLLQIERLHFAYPDGTRALHGIDLSIAAAERVGLIGPNGSGKSTLLMCMSGLFSGQGCIRVEGVDMSTARAASIRDRVGLIFQSPDDQLFMPTLADDLAFGPINQGLSDAQVHERVHRVAEQMGLEKMLDRAPHHLSMGQKRNAAIAAVLAMQPSILLMDEPSSNLDPRSRRHLIDILLSLHATMLIASHDLALVGRVCERVVVIDEGRIVADGPTAQIIENATLMEQHGLEAHS
jgi:cobalt/nickel transport system ATP-binding protein